MDNNQVIKQSSPRNILWRLFRIGVEEEAVPKTVAENNQKFVNEMNKKCEKDKTEC